MRQDHLFDIPQIWNKVESDSYLTILLRQNLPENIITNQILMTWQQNI